MLFIASERGDLQVVKMLIEAKADVNIKAKVGALASSDTYISIRKHFQYQCAYGKRVHINK